jgi:HPr kinase/phosphorylase
MDRHPSPKAEDIPTETIHACAVAIGEKGLLILGESGSGKSRLLLEMLADQRHPRVRLVADDRVILTKYANQLIARPHPLIAGQMEIRGLGVQNFPYLEAVVLHSVLRLVHKSPERMPEADALNFTALGVTLPSLSMQTQSFSSQHFRAIFSFIS